MDFSFWIWPICRTTNVECGRPSGLLEVVFGQLRVCLDIELDDCKVLILCRRD